MAPGIFCIWSTTSPLQSDGEDAFTTSLPGVDRAIHIKQADPNMQPPPFTHDLPWLTIYFVSDTRYFQQEEFKVLEKQCERGGGEGNEGNSMARAYEEHECIEQDGCENVFPAHGQVIDLYTLSYPTTGAEKLQKFHRERIAGSFKSSPHYLRARVYRQINVSSSSSLRKTADNKKIASPKLWLHEWDSYELPWAELLKVAEEKEWDEWFEGALEFQAVCYRVESMMGGGVDLEE